MIEESLTKGLTTPVYVIMTFLHIGFHIFQMCSQVVKEESCISFGEIYNDTEVIFTWNTTEMISGMLHVNHSFSQ